MVPLARRTEGTEKTLIFSNEIHHKAQGGVTTETFLIAFISTADLLFISTADLLFISTADLLFISAADLLFISTADLLFISTADLLFICDSFIDTVGS